MKWKLLFLSLLLLFINITFIYAESQNLIMNPSFEVIRNDSAINWSVYSWEKGPDAYKITPDHTQKRTGNTSILIENLIPNDVRYKQTINVNPATTYKLSCWIRTENVKTGNKGANISAEMITETSSDIKGTTNEWQYVELYGKTDKKQNSLTFTIGLGGYGSLNSGKAWFDDVQVEEVSKVPQGSRVINLFASNTGGQAGNSGNQSSNSGILFILATLLLIVGFGIYYLYKNRNTLNDTTIKATGKTPLSIIKFDHTDLIIITVMVIVYTAMTLINLGSTKAPSTSWLPQAKGDSMTLKLEKKAMISRISYFCGHGKTWAATGQYSIKYINESGDLVPLTNIQKDNMFVWKYIDVQALTDTLVVTAEDINGTLNEVAFFEEGNTSTPLKVNITETNHKKENAQKLIDEQEMAAYRPTYYNGTYFDEIYHARTAYEHIHQIEPYENTHPPLGKLLISVGILLFGMNPFGWRVVGALFGVAMLPFMYMFGRKIFANRFYAFAAAFLMMFDFMHFSQTRISTIDVYGTFFIILMYYFMYDYYVNNSFIMDFKKSIKPLLLSGLFFGLGIASKWIAIYGGAGLALLFFFSKINGIREYNKARFNKNKRRTPLLDDYLKKNILATILCGVAFFVIVPGIIYFISYLPILTLPGKTNMLAELVNYQKHMFNYHSTLKAQHSFSSPWYEWPIIYKPTWFYGGTSLPQGIGSSIVTMGNPAIWWLGIITLFTSTLISIIKWDRKMFVILAGFAFQYVPWMLVPRITWIYHFFASVPFMIIMLVYTAQYFIEKNKSFKYAFYTYLGFSALLFVIFYPVLSGLEVSKAYIDHLKWFKSWIF